MAYYGIPSAGQALTASVGNDTVAIANLGGTLVTAQSVYGADGNDIISLGAVGRIVTGSASFSGNVTNVSGADTISGSIVASVVGSATNSTSLAFTCNVWCNDDRYPVRYSCHFSAGSSYCQRCILPGQRR